MEFNSGLKGLNYFCSHETPKLRHGKGGGVKIESLKGGNAFSIFYKC
jgi:hypothetical protein